MKKLWLKQSPEIKNTILGAILVVAVFIFLYLFKFEGNITGFFRIGSILPLSPYLNSDQVFIYKDELGYDGQQFLSIALDPFLQNPDTIEALDSPLYRYRRILYPLLSSILGFGNPQLIPYMMVSINCISIVLIVFVSSLYLRQDKGINWEPLLVLCLPGVWMVLSLSTSDLLSSLLLVLAIYFYRNNQEIYTAIAIASACLTRETMLLIWLGFLLTSIWERKWRQMLHLFWALIPVASWNIYVFVKLNSQGFSGVNENFGYPFLGIFNKLRSLLTGGFSRNNIFEAYLFLLLITILIAIIIIWQYNRKNNKVVLLCAILYGVLLSISSMTILNYYLNYSRVYMDVYFLLLFSINHSSIPWKTIPLASAGLASIAFIIGHS
ncbi:MAG: hypothetical protein F6K10_39980 [Moorea sp. SIO2B7]|nr:hypothetical protein [Moorena sp. SIO2B7]